MFADSITSLKPGEKELKMAEKLGIDMIGYEGEEIGKFAPIKIIEANSQEEVKSGMDKWRSKALLIAVKGNYEANRTAMHDSRADVVIEPFFWSNDLGIDHICLKKAEENDVAIAVEFIHFLSLHKKDRVRYLRQLRRTIELAEKYSVKIIMASGAETWLDMRKPREMASLLINLGMPFEDAMKSVSEWPASIFSRNREKIEGKRKGGVWIE